MEKRSRVFFSGIFYVKESEFENMEKMLKTRLEESEKSKKAFEEQLQRAQKHIRQLESDKFFAENMQVSQTQDSILQTNRPAYPHSKTETRADDWNEELFEKSMEISTLMSEIDDYKKKLDTLEESLKDREALDLRILAVEAENQMLNDLLNKQKQKYDQRMVSMEEEARMLNSQLLRQSQEFEQALNAQQEEVILECARRLDTEQKQYEQALENKNTQIDELTMAIAELKRKRVAPEPASKCSCAEQELSLWKVFPAWLGSWTNSTSNTKRAAHTNLTETKKRKF